MSYNRAEYDTEALRHNVALVRELVGPNRKILTAVKANGYGMGVLPMVHTLLEEGVDYLAVAILEEAMELRANGITAPILILGSVPPKEMAKAIYNDVTMAIYSFEGACMADYLGGELDKKAKVHIKLDTGMHRLGFPLKADSFGKIKVISEMPNLEVEGIFSHLSQADCSEKFTKNQISAFKEFVDTLEQGGVHFQLRHLANSIGILDYPDAYFDMVRAGILLHGFGSASENSQKLKEVMSLKSAVVRLHDAESGAEVSYTGSFKADSVRRIATIPVGYADGYFRCLANKAQVLIGGKRVPQVGNICMDQFMVDVTDVPGVKIGDEVVLIGAQGDEFISCQEVADWANTITYEILTSMKRIPKYYYFEDDDD